MLVLSVFPQIRAPIMRRRQHMSALQETGYSAVEARKATRSGATITWTVRHEGLSPLP